MTVKILIDSGPIITITTSALLPMLGKFKQKYDVQFLITESVRKELVDVPLNIKRFELEAIYVSNEIKKENLIVANPGKELEDLTQKIANIMNSIILVNNTPLELMHHAELETLAYGIINNIDIICVDERNTRLLIEDPWLLSKIIGSRLHKKTTVNEQKYNDLKLIVKNLKIVRSSELAIKAIKDEIISFNKVVDKKELVNAVLWNFKLHGCTISINDIEKAKQSF